jgi:hypothetical protein
VIEATFAAALIGWFSYRLWRFLAVDVITIRFRARLFGIKIVVDDPAELGEAPKAEDEAEARWPKLFHMWHCPWCLGFHLAWMTTVVTDVVIDGGLPAPGLVAGAAAAVTGLLGANDPDQMYSSS